MTNEQKSTAWQAGRKVLAEQEWSRWYDVVSSMVMSVAPDAGPRECSDIIRWAEAFGLVERRGEWVKGQPARLDPRELRLLAP